MLTMVFGTSSLCDQRVHSFKARQTQELGHSAGYRAHTTATMGVSNMRANLDAQIKGGYGPASPAVGR